MYGFIVEDITSGVSTASFLEISLEKYKVK